MEEKGSDLSMPEIFHGRIERTYFIMKGSMNMFTDDQFKSLLIKTLERKGFSNSYEAISDLVFKIKISDVTLDETDDYTYYQGYKKGWNTLCTYLKILMTWIFLKVIKLCLPRQQAPYTTNKVIMY